MRTKTVTTTTTVTTFIVRKDIVDSILKIYNPFMCYDSEIATQKLEDIKKIVNDDNMHRICECFFNDDINVISLQALDMVEMIEKEVENYYENYEDYFIDTQEDENSLFLPFYLEDFNNVKSYVESYKNVEDIVNFKIEIENKE